MSAQAFLEYQFNEEIAERAARSHKRSISRGLGMKFWRAFPYVLLPALACGAITLYGDRSDLAGSILWAVSATLAGVFGILAALMALLQLFAVGAISFAHWRNRRDLRRWTASLKDPTVRWEFSDEAFTSCVGGTDRRTPWRDVKRVRMDEDFWMFEVKDGPILFLPVERLSVEAKEIIRAKTPAPVAVVTDEQN